MKIEINSKGESADFLHKLKSKLQRKHETELMFLMHKNREEGIKASAITLQESVTIWSLLMEIVAWFILNYVKEGKIEFKLWNLKKNLEAIIHMVRFFKKVMVFIQD